MKISDELEILEISMNSIGIEGVINPTLLRDANSVILIDTGLSGLIPEIKRELKNLNIALSDITKVIITHSDLDHIGNLAAIQNELGKELQVYSHTEEKPYIEFDKKSSKITDDQFNKLKDSAIPQVNCLLNHGDRIEACGGITVLHTPGHTPGHICLYLEKHNILIAGDALNVINGKLLGPHPRHTPNFQEAIDSLKQLLNYDIEKVICYHGGLYTGNLADAINNLL